MIWSLIAGPPSIRIHSGQFAVIINPPPKCNCCQGRFDLTVDQRWLTWLKIHKGPYVQYSLHRANRAGDPGLFYRGDRHQRVQQAGFIPQPLQERLCPDRRAIEAPL